MLSAACNFVLKEIFGRCDPSVSSIPFWSRYLKFLAKKCDLILENPTYRAKLKNGVIHTTRKLERRRVHGASVDAVIGASVAEL